MSYGNRAKFYKSKQWQDTRNAYLNSVGGLCELCLLKGKIVPAEIVHHKEHLGDTFTPEQALSFSNLQALCRRCHAEQHPEVYGKDKPKQQRYEILSDGSVYIVDDDCEPL